MKEKQNLSQEMIENIKNYESEIQTLETFVQQVRQNPGYHLGSIGNKGLLNMIREIVQNSLDELDKESSPCTEVTVAFNEQLQGTTVMDNGRGIPFGNMVRIFATSSTSSNYTKKKGEYSSGLHGVGSKVTNAMSSIFTVESYILGEGRRVEFVEGYPVKQGVNGEVPITDTKMMYQGTYVYFEPSREALGDTNLSWKEVYNLIARILPLSKIGAIINFMAIDSNGNEYKERLVNTDGIMSFLKDQKESVIPPIEIHNDTGYMKIDAVFTWDAKSDGYISAFANKCPTTYGTHIAGFDDGITKFFTRYMNTVYLAAPSKKKTKITVTPVDVRTGLRAIISVAHLKPIFDGQSKDKLANEDMQPFVSGCVMDALEVWQKNNPKSMTKVCSYLKDIAEIRLSVDNKKIKLSDQYSKSKLNNLPSKYVAPTGNPNKVKTELFIVEGDSAAGHIRNHRDNVTQGYFPIRGKLPNAFNTSRTKFLSNAEIAGIIAIIGGGYGKDFDITKVKWDKIIICTDADSDGAHIAVLIERFILLYMPELIIHGKLYKAVPPLYGIRKGNKVQYIHDKLHYIKYRTTEFLKKHTIEDYKGGKLSNREIDALFFKNADYTYEMSKLENLAINPILLEITLMSILNKEPVSKLAKSIKKEAKFIEKVEQNKDGVIIIEGLYQSKYQSIYVTDKLLQEAKKVMDILASNTSFVYRMDGAPVSIYQLMSEFDKSTLPGESKGSSIQRYKGLGEMDADELQESTLDIRNRILIQYTIDDLKTELDAIRYYENNNLSELMTGIKVTRADLLS